VKLKVGLCEKKCSWGSLPDIFNPTRSFWRPKCDRGVLCEERLYISTRSKMILPREVD